MMDGEIRGVTLCSGAKAIAWAVDVVLLLREHSVQPNPSLMAAMPLVQPVLWAIAHRNIPSVPDIQARFDVHRSTAYRWLPELRRAWEAVHSP